MTFLNTSSLCCLSGPSDYSWCTITMRYNCMLFHNRLVSCDEDDKWEKKDNFCFWPLPVRLKLTHLLSFILLILSHPPLSNGRATMMTAPGRRRRPQPRRVSIRQSPVNFLHQQMPGWPGLPTSSPPPVHPLTSRNLYVALGESPSSSSGSFLQETESMASAFFCSAQHSPGPNPLLPPPASAASPSVGLQTSCCSSRMRSV